MDVVVVAKRTAYAEHVLERHDPHAIRLLEAGDASVARWLQAHSDHEHALTQVLEALGRRSLSHTVVPASKLGIESLSTSSGITRPVIVPR